MCHGPAMEHANAQSRIRAGSERWMKADLYADLTRRARDLVPPTTITQTTCLTCHTDERPEACGAEDEPFDFESAVRRLGHPDGKR